MLVELLILVSLIGVYSLDNGVARTPPMGWDTYNGFHAEFNDLLLMQMGDLLVSTGMKDVGYNRVNVDGGWEWEIEVNGTRIIQRNETGYILPDPVKFPDG
eukprot:850916_1